ncbi:MAG: hypothetical protein AAF609_18525 [Cyanobacteria bacterium P01_C01_bin.120]
MQAGANTNKNHLGSLIFNGLPVQVALASGMTDTMTVVCCDIPTRNAVRERLMSVVRFCEAADIKFIETWVKMGSEMRLSDRISIESLRVIMKTTGTIQTFSDAEIFARFHAAAQKGESLSLVCNENHRGLLTTHNESCGVSIPEWTGADMSQYWEAAELRRYLGDMEQYGVMNGYRWKAFQMDGGRHQIEQYGNVQRVGWHGLDCRLVSVREVAILG